MKLTVRRDISGSHVVVFFGPNPWNPNDPAYIDARKDTRYPNHSFIECVRAGQVRHKECVHNDNAPERIMEMVRNIQKGLTP